MNIICPILISFSKKKGKKKTKGPLTLTIYEIPSQFYGASLAPILFSRIGSGLVNCINRTSVVNAPQNIVSSARRKNVKKCNIKINQATECGTTP